MAKNVRINRILTLVMALSLRQDIVAAIDCLYCSNVGTFSDCQVTKSCLHNEICSVETFDHGDGNTSVSLGCKTWEQCYPDSGHRIDVIGRSTVSTCSECCSQPFCNGKVCGHPKSEPASTTTASPDCVDSEMFNCEIINATFNICPDIQHAKTVCKKFCQLCDLVDGGWGSWSEWSACKETCGNTIRARTRACDDPYPAGAGLDCIGDKQQFDSCTLKPCPVHGGWSSWDSWSACSKTCGIGLQRRDRHCSSPYPDYGGNHCFGDALENRICMDKACSDGGWTLWSVWSGCSQTCGQGLMSRSRSCSNPLPSTYGKACTGSNVEYSMCTHSKCSDTTSTDKVYFSVNTPTGTLYGQHSPIFSKVVINTGGGYDTTTGKFTAPKAGVYQFISTFVTNRSTTQCFIRKNGDILVYALTTAVNDYKSASASTYVHLDTGDVVDQSCGGWQYVDHNATSMFSGALVSAD